MDRADLHLVPMDRAHRRPPRAWKQRFTGEDGAARRSRPRHVVDGGVNDDRVFHQARRGIDVQLALVKRRHIGWQREFAVATEAGAERARGKIKPSGSTQHSESSIARLSSVVLGDGWPNLPRKCQPNTSLRSGEIKDSAVFSEEQRDVSGFVARMASGRLG
jgi:hypothetical protein